MRRRESEPELEEQHQHQQLMDLLHPKLLKFNKGASFTRDNSDCGCRRDRGTKLLKGDKRVKTTAVEAPNAPCVTTTLQ